MWNTAISWFYEQRKNCIQKLFYKNMLKHVHGWGLNFTCIVSGLLSPFNSSDKEKFEMKLIILDTFHTCWHESSSDVLLRCQTWRLSFRFNSLISLVYNKARSRVEKGAFVMLIKKQKVNNVNNDAENDISESSFCMFGKSLCRAHEKRKHKWLAIVARDWHIWCHAGTKWKSFCTVRQSLPTRQGTIVICSLWILTFEFSAMLKGKDFCSTLLGESCHVGLILFSPSLAVFQN